MGAVSAREQVVEAARSFSAAGLTIATWGNISLRSGESVFITPSGMDYAALLPEDITEVAFADGACSPASAGPARRRRCTWRYTPPGRRPAP